MAGAATDVSVLTAVMSLSLSEDMDKVIGFALMVVPVTREETTEKAFASCAVATKCNATKTQDTFMIGLLAFSQRLSDKVVPNATVADRYLLLGRQSVS